MTGPTTPHTRRVLITIGLTVAALTGLLLLWYARDVVLLAFAGVLLALLIRTPASWLSDRTSLPVGVSLATVVIGLLAILTLAFWLRGPEIQSEASDLRERLPIAAEELKQRLERHEWGQRAIERLPSPEELVPDRGSAISKATGVVSRTFSVLANFVIIIFLGLVFAGGPQPYVNGIVRLVPVGRQPRARELLAEIALTLRWWLVGRLISMTVVGVMTGVGLWALGVPLAFVLGLLAALLSFIPNLGPLLSAIPAVLLGLAESPQKALFVALLYMGVQAVESWVVNPIVDRKTVYLPPGIVLLAQLTFALAAGLLGLALATPLIAALVVMVKMLYVEDVLGQTVMATEDE